MKTPAVTEVEIIYDRESESPLPKSVIDLTFTKDGKRDRKGSEVPVLGDGLDLEDPMVSHYADTGVQLGQDEKAAIDPSNILNGADRLRHKPFTSERCEDEGRNEDDLPSDIGDGVSGGSALQLIDGT
ncbi:uncharacterized protein N7496_005788 [Penicillium cataractarum]|uniref:Uncharacterized protein n=1 Tax=Penicillium cataractarum TaxID=2100454 RepID=A0A9W9S0J6_9EURO|nr:uncharacterized protein N7496_005788 [Penicillium cataractarum]KAJ5369696.1 hypothetical protein N7496_005788 [Penicillium cataractarum]